MLRSQLGVPGNSLREMRNRSTLWELALSWHTPRRNTVGYATKFITSC